MLCQDLHINWNTIKSKDKTKMALTRALDPNHNVTLQHFQSHVHGNLTTDTYFQVTFASNSSLQNDLETGQEPEFIKLLLFGISQGWCSIIAMHPVGTPSPSSGPERPATRLGLKLPLQSSSWPPTRVDTNSVMLAGSRTAR